MKSRVARTYSSGNNSCCACQYNDRDVPGCKGAGRSACKYDNIGRRLIRSGDVPKSRDDVQLKLSVLSVERLKKFSLKERLDIFYSLESNLSEYLSTGTYLIKDATSIIRNLILSSKGKELYDFKTTIDTNVSCTNNNTVSLLHPCMDMEHIIYELMDDENREAVIEHIQKEAVKRRKRYIHVISDIDDTITAGGAGGSDTRFPPSTVYPGILALFEEISQTDHITFLSATPLSLEASRRSKLRPRVRIPVNFLSGKHRDVPFMVGNIFLTAANTKVMRFRRYASIYPEYSFVFFGDSGQGDLITSKEIMTKNVYLHQNVNAVSPERVLHSIINDIVTKPAWSFYREEKLSDFKVGGLIALDDRKHLESTYDITVVDNYIDAAIKLYRKGLLKRGKTSLRAVTQSAIAQTNELLQCVNNDRSSVFKKPERAIYPLVCKQIHESADRARHIYEN